MSNITIKFENVPTIEENKASLVEKVQAVLGGTKADAERAVEALFDAITGELKKGGEVSVAGFGIFSVKARAAGRSLLQRRTRRDVRRYRHRQQHPDQHALGARAGTAPGVWRHVYRAVPDRLHARTCRRRKRHADEQPTRTERALRESRPVVRVRPPPSHRNP